ncbi:hypothetical protein [uncultured Aliivibrio sp.]|uniref:hypothetical protein n=1 Tax=uncultured Aliivibrio sp. TaxID=873085 RepID=UPI00260F8807|nr:hypothetical protein [uncultured Aliivibrio sp.]
MSNNFYKNKDVLLVSPYFYSYHKGIVKALKDKGANVKFVPEVNNSFFYRLSKKISPKLQCFLENKHKKKILNACKQNSFDLLLVIRGELFDKNLLTLIRKELPNADFYMYQWDSYRHADYRDVIKCFKRVSTFDSSDAKELCIPYLPLFYLPEYKSNTCYSEKKYALSFFGAYHGDRLDVIKFFTKELEQNSSKHKFHLYMPLLSFLYRLLVREVKVSDFKYFTFYKAKSSDISKVYSESIAVLDVELAIQSGLSIRTFEVLSSGAKLLTTNFNIKREKLYNEDVVNCINRNDLIFDPHFFESKKIEISLDDYSVSKWLDNVFLVK